MQAGSNGNSSMKVHKINAPLLVIGMGGTGFDAVMRIKKTFSERFVSDVAADNTERGKPPRTAYLVVDTDPSTKDMKKFGMKLDVDEFFDISNSISDLLNPKSNLLLPWERQWLDLENLQSADFTHGAGVYRQVSRLFLFKKASQFVNKITATLSEIVHVDRANTGGSVQASIVILTGISGGTGSGTLIDIPYLIRHAVSGIAIKGISCDISSYIVAPDVTITHHAIADPKFQALYSANGFAALKELDYWQGIDRHGQHFCEQYTDQITVDSHLPPYDEVTLLCSRTATGDAIRDSYDHVMDVVAEYLLHSLAGDEQGRETFSYFAESDNAGESDVYGFQSAKSNERAAINMLPKQLPVSYSYRAIGAFSNAGEQQDVQNYQSLLIFQDILDIQANRPQMAGTEPDVFWREVISEQLDGQLRMEFQNATMWDETNLFGGDVPFDMTTLASCDVRDGVHGDHYTEWEKKPRQEAEAFRRRAHEALWGAFETAAKAVITNPKKGPAFLQELLNGPQNGFIARVESAAAKAEAQEQNARTSRVTDLSRIDEDFGEYQRYSRGLHPFKRQKTWETYMGVAHDLYEATQMEMYYQSWSRALAALAEDVRQYVTLRLRYYNLAVDTIHADLLQRDRTAALTREEYGIINRDLLHQRIREDYEDEHRREELKSLVLSTIARHSFVNRQVREDEAAEALIRDLGEFIRTSFASISSMSLEVMMTHFGSLNGMDVEQYVCERLAPRMSGAAMPMISVTSEFTGLPPERARSFCYISVPQGAQDIVKGIEAFKRTNTQYVGATVKRSGFSDRIFWLNSAAGLPLACYNSLESLEETYDRMKNVHPALHLRMDTARTRASGDDEAAQDDPTLRDWTLLPSPLPKRSAYGDERVDPVLDAAVAQGLLDIRYGEGHQQIGKEEAYGYTVYTIPSRVASVLTREEMQGLIEAALAEPTLRRQRQALDALRQGWFTQGSESIERTRDKCIAWSVVLGARTPSISNEITRQLGDGSSPVAVERAKAAWDACYRAVVYEWIGRQPRRMHGLRKQVELAGMLETALAGVRERLDEAVYESARRVARMMLFDQLDVMPAVVRYRDGQGNFEHAGRDNELFDGTMNVYSDESYDYLPILIRLTDWYFASEDGEDMRLRLIERSMQEQERAVKQMRTAADAQPLIDRAGALLKTLGNSRYTLEHRAADIDRAHYERAERIYLAMEGELKRFAAQFETIL